MISFWRIFFLELTAFVRSKSLILLLAATAGWMFAAPFVLTGDGTSESMRELVVRNSLGGVAALAAVALLSSATGAFARERAAKRLQLTLVRPVRYTVVALAKIAALVFAGAIVIVAAAVVEALRSPLDRQCRHVLSPMMESPREEAYRMYAAYMSDTNTPKAVKQAKPDVVLRLLALRALDRYESVRCGASAHWRFALPETFDSAKGAFAKMRFASEFGMRQDVAGELSLSTGGVSLAAAVSNVTQSVVDIPLAVSSAAGEAEKGVLEFRNCGKTVMMLRPRRDVKLLVPADTFGWNLTRACVELVAIIALIVSFGVFLGAALSRPVALFAAFTALVVAEISPSVLEQYPDELETNPVDAIGLQITRAAAELAHPISSLEPMAKLSDDTCIEAREVVRATIADIVVAPLAFAFLSALVLPRKSDVC